VKHLEEFPYSGRIIPETSNPQLREVTINNYPVMYHISDTSINIFAVYEGHKNPKDLSILKHHRTLLCNSN